MTRRFRFAFVQDPESCFIYRYNTYQKKSPRGLPQYNGSGCEKKFSKIFESIKKLNIACNCCMAGYLARIVVCINMLECKVYIYQHVNIELYTYACLYFWKICMVE
jgi:hypothetical protein